MSTFIEDYLQCPSMAVRNASIAQKSVLPDWDEEMIYSEIASPEFRLYMEIALSHSDEEIASQLKTFVRG